MREECSHNYVKMREIKLQDLGFVGGGSEGVIDFFVFEK